MPLPDLPPALQLQKQQLKETKTFSSDTSLLSCHSEGEARRILKTEILRYAQNDNYRLLQFKVNMSSPFCKDCNLLTQLNRLIINKPPVIIFTCNFPALMPHLYRIFSRWDIINGKDTILVSHCTIGVVKNREVTLHVCMRVTGYIHLTQLSHPDCNSSILVGLTLVEKLYSTANRCVDIVKDWVGIQDIQICPFNYGKDMGGKLAILLSQECVLPSHNLLTLFNLLYIPNSELYTAILTNG